MLCFTKLSSRIILTISVFCFFLSVSVVAQEIVDSKLFDEVTKQVKELKKTDLALSLKRLTLFKNKLSSLSIEQNILYFKLLSKIQIEQNKYIVAKETANHGLSIAKSLASPSIFISELLYLKGSSFESLGDISQATKEYKKGLEVAESLHNKAHIALGLIKLGTIAYRMDDFKRALILLNDAYNIAIQTDDEELKGIANRELGILYSHLQQDIQSMAYYQQSYLYFKNENMRLAAHNSLINIADTHIRNKNYQQAITVLKKIIAESNKDTPSESMLNVYLGMTRSYLNKKDRNIDIAYQYLLMAKQNLQRTEKLDYQLQFYIDEAYILYELNRFDEALISIEYVENILDSHLEVAQVRKESYLSILDLKASIFYKQKSFRQAYETKSKVIKLISKTYDNDDNSAITQVRLKLEIEQADKQNKLLYNQKILHDANFDEANLQVKEQYRYLVVSALVALAFAWVLVKLIQNQHKLKIASSIDALTRASNRRSLMIKSQNLFKRAKIKETELSVLMIDVDCFKSINDGLGHHIGDKVLVQIASISASLMRKNDIFGRFGGEEFMIFLPNTDLKAGLQIGERIRRCIYNYSWQIPTLETVSVSIGVASLANDNDVANLIKRADEQLYQAKASGRNKVCGQ